MRYNIRAAFLSTSSGVRGLPSTSSTALRATELARRRAAPSPATCRAGTVERGVVLAGLSAQRTCRSCSAGRMDRVRLRKILDAMDQGHS